jgi:hypothetical protein
VKIKQRGETRKIAIDGENLIFQDLHIQKIGKMHLNTRNILKLLYFLTHVARMGVKRNAHTILMGKLAEKRPLQTPGRRWQDNIKMDLRGIGWDDMDWIYLARDGDQWRALVNTVMNLRFP